jgi:nucleotidyltransferase/DNA polymerase involved in DNA repair
VTVKIRDSSFRTITRQRGLAPPTDLTEPIWHAAVELARPEVRGLRIRLLGVTCSNFEELDQLGLFDELPGRAERRRRAVEAADRLRRRYGERAVTRARLVGTGLPAPFERDPRTAPEQRVGAVPATDSAGRRSGAGSGGKRGDVRVEAEDETDVDTDGGDVATFEVDAPEA